MLDTVTSLGQNVGHKTALPVTLPLQQQIYLRFAYHQSCVSYTLLYAHQAGRSYIPSQSIFKDFEHPGYCFR